MITFISALFTVSVPVLLTSGGVALAAAPQLTTAPWEPAYQADVQPLLAVLSLGQRPTRPSVAAPAAPPSLDASSASPLQIDGGWDNYRVYEMQQSDGSSYTFIGDVVVPNISNATGAFVAGTEYWYLSSDVITSGPSDQAVRFTWTDYSWSSEPQPPVSGSLSFTVPQNPTWSGAVSAPGAEANLFVDNTDGICIQWGLTKTGRTWSGSLTWYSTTAANTVFTGLSSGVSLSPNTAAQMSSTWYKVTQSLGVQG
jgi:hypothetical protein